MASDTPSLREHFEDGIRVGEWFVEPMLNRVQQDDETIQLEPKVMEVLLCMARRPGKTITKERFKEEVWTDTVVTDDVLSRCISQLRKVFDDDPKDPSYIETIRKTGYRLVAPVERAEDVEAELKSSEDVTESASDRPIRGWLEGLTATFGLARAGEEPGWIAIAGEPIRQRWLMAAGGLIVVLLGFAAALWLSSDFTASADGPISAVPLTSFPGEEFDPSLSSLGHQVAFAWRQPDSLDQNIYIMQRGAEQPLRLTADSTVDWSPAWSPDGRFVAYVQQVSGDHRVSVVPSIGGHDQEAFRTREREIRSVGWLPDTTERTLVMSAERRPHQALALSTLSVDADSIAQITAPPLWSTGDASPTPSPDGSQIAFVRGTLPDVEDIFVVPADGGTPTQLTTDSTDIDGLTWSADGSQIVYAAQRSGVSGLWQVPVDGGEPSLIRAASEGTQFSHPTVSARSDRLAYTQKSAQLDVWKLSRPNEYADLEPASLLSSTQKDMHPSIGPDGDRIAFVSDRSGTPEVWVANGDGSQPDRLTSLGGASIHAVQWSPDGERLCLVARKRGHTDLYVVPASGGSATRLTKGPAEELVPRWSQDGRRIYFSSNRTGEWEAWRTTTHLDSQRVEQVTSGGAVAMQEAPTDSMLYLVRPDTAGIWSVPLDTTKFPVPVGPSILAANTKAASGAAGESPSMGPALLDAGASSSSSLERVIEDFNPRERGNWWVGENGIHFVHRRSNRAVLAYFDFASGRILPLHEFPDWRPIQSIAVGPDGEWFAYTHVARRESDVMVIDNFQ